MTILNEIFEKGNTNFFFVYHHTMNENEAFITIQQGGVWEKSLKELIESKSSEIDVSNVVDNFDVRVRNAAIEIARMSRRGVGSIVLIPDEKTYKMVMGQSSQIPFLDFYYTPEIESGFVYVIFHKTRHYEPERKMNDGPFAIMEDGIIYANENPERYMIKFKV